MNKHKTKAIAIIKKKTNNTIFIVFRGEASNFCQNVAFGSSTGRYIPSLKATSAPRTFDVSFIIELLGTDSKAVLIILFCFITFKRGFAYT